MNFQACSCFRFHVALDAPVMSASVNPRFSFPPPSLNLGGGTGPHLRVPQSGGYVFRPRNVEGVTFDGKRMRNKSVLRRTVDYNPSVMNYLEVRCWVFI